VEGDTTVSNFRRWMWLALTVVGALVWAPGCERKPSADSPPGSPGQDSATNAQTPRDNPEAVQPLKLLVVNDPDLAKSIAGQWQAMTGKKLDLVEQTTDEIEHATGALDADIVIYPTALLGTLAERGQITPLPEDVANGNLLRRRDQLEMTRLRETVWGETTYAVPLGSSQFVLFYRRDLLEKVGAKPPDTWNDYQKLAEQLASAEVVSDGQPAEGRSWFGTAEPLGPGWGGLVLLARGSAYARHRSQYSTVFDFSTFEPRIASPPFVRALEELVAAAKFGSPEALQMSPDDARLAVETGRCAMALTWPRAAGSTVEGRGATADTESVAGKIGIVRCPGSADVYNAAEARWEQRGEGEPHHVSLLGVSGRLGSVTKGSRYARGAANFLAMLSGAEWHPRVLAVSRAGGLFRNSHVDSPANWVDASLSGSTATEYGRLVQQIHREDGWLFSPRVPGYGEYLAALDQAVTVAVEGKATAAEALQQAAQQWEAITNERGREAQRRAYRRCLGLEK